MVKNRVSEVPDAQLQTLVERELDALAPRARALALAVHGGRPTAAAARDLGISTNPQVLSRMKKRTATALALLSEQMRRRSIESAEDAARWFDSLAQEARKAKDRNAAARAKREASLLRGHYPKDSIVMGGGAVQVLVVNTGIPTREPAPLPPGVDPYHRTLEGAPTSIDVQERVPVISTSPILGGGSNRG